MRLITICLAAATLSGCATSVAGLGRDEVDMTLTSAKPPRQVATCLATTLIGSNPLLELSDTHFAVIRNNGYGVPVVRWDIIGTPTGSRVELRASIGINTGDERARACL